MTKPPVVRFEREVVDSPLQLAQITESPGKKYIEGPSADFMSRNSNKKKEPMITDWDVYRKRNGLKKRDKIFICKEYVSFKKALKERGWHENKDYNSPVFHLKFTVKSKDVYKNQKGTTA